MEMSDYTQSLLIATAHPIKVAELILTGSRRELRLARGQIRMFRYEWPEDDREWIDDLIELISDQLRGPTYDEVNDGT